MATNIVATITGNGAALTAEINKTFGSIPGMAKNVGKELGNLFDTEFEKGARKAETAARASARSISEIVKSATVTNGAVQFDSAGIKATIAARNQELQVMEALLQAKQRLVAKDSDATRESQVYLATLRQTVNEERQAIAALTSKAQVLDNLQAELGQTAVQQGRVNAVSGQARAGMQQLSFQISDVAQSFASGVSPMVIFGQQASQVVQAVGMMSKTSGGLIGFLQGPWGAALTGAAVVMGMLAFRNNETKNSTQDNERAQRTLTEVLKDQKSTQQEVTKALDEYNKAQGKAREITLDSLKDKEKTIAANLKEAESTKIKTKATLEDIVAEYARANTPEARARRVIAAGGDISGQDANDANRIIEIRKQISDLDGQIEGLRKASKNVNVEVATERARLLTDSAARIEDEYRRKELRLKREISDQDQLTAAIARNTRAKERALEADRDANRSERGSGAQSQKLPKVTGQEVAQLIGAPIASGKRTAAQNAAAKGARNSYHLTDQAIDIPLTVNGKPLTKEGIRAALAPAGVIIKELLGPGDKGHDDHFHIAFDKKRATSDAVANDAARDAKKAQDELAASLKNVTSLFDPAAQAAAEYRLQLQEIKKLENAGVANGGISAEDAKRYRDELADSHAAKLDAIEDARHAKFLGNMSKEFQMAGELGGDVAEKMVSDYLATTEAAEAKIVEMRQQDIDRQRQEFEELASFYERAFQSGGRSIWSDFKQLGKRALADLAAQATIKLLGGGGQSGGNGLLGSLFGNGSGGASNLLGGGSSALSGLSSAAGPAAAAVAVNQGIGKLLGNDQLKSGMLLTLIMGPFLAKLVGSAKKGSATLGFNNGELGVGSTSGNNSSRIGAAKDGIGAVGDILNQIADGVGGNVTGAGSVSLGIRKKTYVVDPTGRGRTKGAGVLKFKDEQDAIEAAVRDALQDGVIAGISDAAKRILSSGQDLQKAIQKAATIESIPKALKARLNPVGAALDALNAKWDQTIATLKEGGASAEQMADAEKLYRLEREDALKAANDNLKEFINSLNFGSSSTYSLMDQSKAARADLDKYLGNINSGNFGAVDQQKYLQSAQSFLDIQRELGGSGTGWFNSVDELRTATQKLADGLEKGSAEAAARDPFAEATASATQATADILAQQTTQLASINGYLASLAAGTSGASGGGGGSSFIGSDRSFVVRER